MISKLIFSFFQISATLRKGLALESTTDGINEVVFEENAQNNRFSANKANLNLAKLRTLRSRGIIIALFFLPKDNEREDHIKKLHEKMDEISNVFSLKYKNIIDSKLADFKDMTSENPKRNITQSQMMENFIQFNEQEKIWS